MSWFNAGSMSIKIQFRDKTHIDELVRDIQETLSNHYEMLDTEKFSFFFYFYIFTFKNIYLLAAATKKLCLSLHILTSAGRAPWKRWS